jgi:hypothetical protein
MRVMTLAGPLFVAGLVTAASAAMSEALAPPTVKIVSPNPLTVHLTSANTASFNLSIENDGPQIAATDFAISVVSDRSHTKTSDEPSIKINTVNGLPVALRGTTVTTVPVTLTVHDQNTTTLTAVLTITKPAGVAPSTDELKLTRSPVSSNFYAIGGASLGMGLLVLLTFWRYRDKPNPPKPPNPDSDIIYTESTFSFSGSWATSISGVLTIVATVFTTTGVLTSLVPGVDTGFFLTVTVVYALILSLGPLVYSALQKTSDDGLVYGTKRGFKAAAAITAAAVGGQLSTVGAVIGLSDLDGRVQVVLLVFLGVVSALMVFYAEMTRRQLWRLLAPKPVKPGQLGTVTPVMRVTPVAGVM